jgi:hypothetical protein
MSNGDDEPDDAADADVPETVADPEDIATTLDEAEESLEAAETEADLDEVEATLDDAAGEIERLPEADEDDEEDPAADLQDRLDSLREDLEAQRGPYAEDVAETAETAAETVRGEEWTESGELDVIPAVEAFLDGVGEQLLDTFEPDSEDLADLADALEDAAGAIRETDLDPDEDTETIAELVELAETLESDLEAAETWDDLTVREKLEAQGFYDVLESENRKDYPPEWNAVKLHEQADDVEPILLALEMLESEFMQENVLDSLKRLGVKADRAYDEMEARAGKRDQAAIEVLGNIGNEEALDTLLDYIEGDSNVALQKVTLRAIGEIGSHEATEAVAQKLASDDETLRSHGARTLGLLGDTRAIDPLADTLADDDSDTVRASAAWALRQIGTERALEEVGQYADDSAYLVQAEAEKAV